MKTYPYSLQNLSDVEQLLTYIIKELGVKAFHPDTAFTDYVHRDENGTEIYTFSAQEAEYWEGLLGAAFGICHAEKANLYELAMDV